MRLIAYCYGIIGSLCLTAQSRGLNPGNGSIIFVGMIADRDIFSFRRVSARSDIGPGFGTNGNIMVAADIIPRFIANGNILLSVNIVAGPVANDYMGSFCPQYISYHAYPCIRAKYDGPDGICTGIFTQNHRSAAPGNSSISNSDGICPAGLRSRTQSQGI